MLATGLRGRYSLGRVTAVVVLAVVLAGTIPAVGASPTVGSPAAPLRALTPMPHAASHPIVVPPAWVNVSGGSGPSPGPLGGASVTTDPAADGVLVFGGVLPGGPSNQTWVYTAAGWSQPATATPGPSARSGAGIAWDAAASAVLLYGGILPPSGSRFGNDTWLYRNGTWSNATNASGIGPGPRGAGAMAVDPSTGFPLLFGGTPNGASEPTSTWEYENGSWVDVTLTAGTPPPGRVFPSLASDPAAGGVLLYGGQNTGGGANFADTWLFHNGTWHQLTPGGSTVPGPLRAGELSYDSTYGSMILFGGDRSAGQGSDSTWTFSASGNWTNVTGLVGPPPGPRWDGQIADVPSLGGVIAEGGCEMVGCVPAANDTWKFGVAGISASVQTTSTNFTIGATLHFVANSSGGLGPRTYRFGFGDGTHSGPGAGASVNHSFSQAGPMVVTVTVADGGLRLQNASVRVLIQPLSTGPEHWQLTVANSTPSPRGGAATVYDPGFAWTIVFGGTAVGTGAWRGDTWVNTAGGWADLTGSLPLAPSPRADAVAWYDAGEARILLFGGMTASGPVADTWAYDGLWHNITNQVGAPPSPRGYATVAYDSTDSEAVLFGGLGSSASALGDTWVFQAGQWSNATLSSGVGPASRYWASSADDPSDRGVVLFGGLGCTTALCGDTSVFSGGGWHLLPAGARDPSVRRGALLTLDMGYGADLLFGGDTLGSGSGRSAADTWAFAYGHWTNVSALVGSAPPGRWAGAFVPDGTAGETELLGGCASAGCASGYGDSWVLRLVAVAVSVSESTNRSLAPANSTLQATGSGGLGTLSYSWSFGDGGYSNATGVSNLHHTYRTAGTFGGTVLASDAVGVLATATWLVVLTSPPPEQNGTNQTQNSTNHTRGTTPLNPSHPASGSGAIPTWAILAAVLIGAGAIIGIAFFAWRSRGRSPPKLGGFPGSPPSSTPPGPDAPGAPAAGSGPPPGTAVAGVALVELAPPGLAEASSDPVGPADTGPREPEGAGAGASATLGDRILVHLHRQGRLGEQDLAPTSVTQAGIAEALGRPQSAFARTLQRLEGTGLVFTELRHVRGAARRLKVYRLTGQGEQRATDLRTTTGAGELGRNGPR
jgi:PKD domain-containing protein/galactose oxidase-like protein